MTIERKLEGADLDLESCDGQPLGIEQARIPTPKDLQRGRTPCGGAPRAAGLVTPVSISVWASDGGTATWRFRAGGTARPVSLRWFKNRGPGEVQFDEARGTVPNSGGQLSTRVTFKRPGTYVLRVTANDDSGVGAGNEQCCWTNGYVEFTVLP